MVLTSRDFHLLSARQIMNDIRVDDSCLCVEWRMMKRVLEKFAKSVRNK